eukprot:TRINITY_DN8746_c0_g1_i1.p1 TRINITY_DN8746_c0_g1~~TRINITY_DN8746_c0_g1_i1.p1  ORF type:complete len:459 (+),score=100.18 TRINITY_DN8746_c0_g1_i1:54-1430(+)
MMPPGMLPAPPGVHQGVVPPPVMVQPPGGVPVWPGMGLPIMTPKRESLIKVQGNQKTANMDPILIENIQQSMAFKSLFELRTHDEVLERAEEVVDYINAWGNHGIMHRRGAQLVIAPSSGAAHLSGIKGWVHQYHQPSPAWCIMYKLHMLGLTEEHIEAMLRHDNLYIRCIALIYLRLVLPPAELWPFFEPHVRNTAELTLTSKPNVRQTTVQDIAIGLLTDMKFLDTRFPRIADAAMKTLREHLTQRGLGDKLPDADAAVQRAVQRPKESGAAPRKRSFRGDLDESDLLALKKRKDETKAVQERDSRRREETERRDGRNDDAARKDEVDKRTQRDDRGRRDDRRNDGRDDRRDDRRRDDRRRDDRRDDRRDTRRDDRHRDDRREKLTPTSPSPKEDGDAAKSGFSEMDIALAKLRHVVGGADIAAAGQADEAGRRGSTKQNSLAPATVTLGSRAWGK